LDIEKAVLVGHSTGDGEVACYIVEAERAAEDVVREYEVSKHTSYASKSKYGGARATIKRDQDFIVGFA
jgi:hypothetical protein